VIRQRHSRRRRDQGLHHHRTSRVPSVSHRPFSSSRWQDDARDQPRAIARMHARKDPAMNLARRRGDDGPCEALAGRGHPGRRGGLRTPLPNRHDKTQATSGLEGGGELCRIPLVPSPRQRRILWPIDPRVCNEGKARSTSLRGPTSRGAGKCAAPRCIPVDRSAMRLARPRDLQERTVW
jgi:hypothetical protein